MSDTTQTTAVPETPTPAAVTPVVAAPAATTTFWEYLKDNIPNHLKVLAIIGIIVGGVIGFNYIRDLKAQLAAQQQVTATLAQKFQSVGTAAVSANSTTSQADVSSQADSVFGSALLTVMQQQGSQINSLTTAIGQTNSAVTALAQQQQTTFTPQQQTNPTGQLTGYQMSETRPAGAPPIASVDLFYDPSQHDPTKAFAGTNWTHNQEKFQTSVGEWVKSKDGGLSTTLSLSRTVSKPDPTDPTKTIVVGTESIPITGSNTVYTPTGLTVGAPTVVPRWTLGLGLSKATNTTTGGITAYGALDYRLTSRYGVFLGSANNGIMGGVSIRLDSK